LLHVHSRAAEQAIAAAQEKKVQDAVAAKKTELEEATAKMERVLWKNRHVIETKQAATAVDAFNSDASGGVGTGSLPNPSLAADIRSIRAGVSAHTSTTPLQPDDLEREMQQALETEQPPAEEPWAQQLDAVRQDTGRDTALHTAGDPKARWKQAFEWQKRVATLLASTAPKEDKLASVVKIAAQSQTREGNLARPRPLPREPTNRGERSVSFSANIIAAQTPGLLARKRPQPPARARGPVDATGVRAGVRASPTTRNLVVTVPGGAEMMREDEARIREKIDRAKRALEVKKKTVRTAKALGALSRKSSNFQ
jgi:hypothetical protein